MLSLHNSDVQLRTDTKQRRMRQGLASEHEDGSVSKGTRSIQSSSCTGLHKTAMKQVPKLDSTRVFLHYWSSLH